MFVNQHENGSFTGDGRERKGFTTAHTRGAGAAGRRAQPRGTRRRARRPMAGGDGGPAPSGLSGLPAASRRFPPKRDRTALPAPRAWARAQAQPRRAREERRACRRCSRPGRGQTRRGPAARPPCPPPALPTRPPSRRHPAPCSTSASACRPRPVPAPPPPRGRGPGRAEQPRRPPASSGRRFPRRPAGAGSGPYLTGSAVMSPLPLLGAAGPEPGSGAERKQSRYCHHRRRHLIGGRLRETCLLPPSFFADSHWLLAALSDFLIGRLRRGLLLGPFTSPS